MERIAPRQLLGRESELAELAGFCLQESRGPYVWWRAGPWAGKSALLSTFVLDSSAALVAGRVRLVSFFITARLASQDTREEFVTALSEQLCALLGAELPTGVGEAGREAVLLDLLARAAAACQQEGGRLVLVVDGLDEDRGVTTGPGAHSIAALLPARPPAGMRVIVAGRPDPPIPDDVPDWHPLRDASIVRLLAGSPHARDLRRLGESELKRLLRGNQVEQDLLGLITAARGGLSGPDLRELTGADLVAVEDILHAVAGRTFTRRPPRWAPDGSSQVYLLGHEELHNAACHYLGSKRLTGYRERLHAWAERYHTSTDGHPPWPVHTPEYLLTGYPRMLTTASDIDRLTALAIDPARHDRMLDLSGGDSAALAEITTCQNLLLRGPQPQQALYPLARLSHHRNQLESRNAAIPTQLPAVWVALGQPNRAEALAHSIPSLSRQVQALARVVEALVKTGEHERAREQATDAEQIARTLNPHQQVEAMTAVARAAAAIGEYERAEHIARTLPAPYQQAGVLTVIARAAAAAGEYERAEHIARTLTNRYVQAGVLTTVVEALAAIGEYERAEHITRTLDPDDQAVALAAVAGTAAAAGERERARELATDTEQRARTLPNRYQRAEALAAVAGTAAAAGEYERARELATEAEQIARTLDPDDQVEALAAVTRATAAAGKHERARELATEAERIAGALPDLDDRAEVLIWVVEALAAAGEHERAGQVARTLPSLRRRVGVLAAVAGMAAEAGERERVRELATDAEQIARTLHPDDQAEALIWVVEALAKAGEHERAEQIAHTPTNLRWRARVLAAVARAAVVAGEYERARELATDAEQIARAVTNLDHQAEALAAVARAAAAAGERERARELATDAEQRARTLPNRYVRAGVLTTVVEALAAAGEYERAEHIAHTLRDPDAEAKALITIAETVSPPRAGRLLGEAFARGSWLEPLPVLAKAFPQEAIRIIDAVYVDEQWRHAR